MRTSTPSRRGAALPPRLALLAALLLTLAGALPALAAGPTPLSGFSLAPVAAVSAPTDLAFLPDGRLLITSQFGGVYTWQEGAASPSQALDLSAVICTNSERGVLGVTPDPAFASNGFVYIYYTRRNAADTNGTCALSDNGSVPANPPVNRVSRFTMTAGTISAASELVLVSNIPAPSGNHNAGDLHVAADGYLYITTGDARSITAPQSKTTLRGKILRVDRATGDGVAANPFYGDSGSVNCGKLAPYSSNNKSCREIYALGLRNPFRLAFKPGTSEFYINDVGRYEWEEIDIGAAGANYGWGVREGPCAYGSGPESCVPQTNPPAYVDPTYSYAHTPGSSGQSAIFDGCASITGGAFVPADSGWPAEFLGDYLFADYVCGRIFHLNGGPGSFAPQVLVNDLAEDSATSMVFGPSGTPGEQALYFATYNGGGQVRRLTYEGGANGQPNAALQATSPTSTAGTSLNVSFSGAGSSDPDGIQDIVKYVWDFGDGTPAVETSGATTSHTFTVPAGQVSTFDVTLRVRDSQGWLSLPSAAVEVTVGNTLPVATISSPAPTDRFDVGQVITLTGSATDGGQPLPASSLTWEVVRHHGFGGESAHTHPYMAPVTGNNLTIVGPGPEDLEAADDSFLEVRLYATDSQGSRSAVVTRNLMPNLVTLSFNTQPQGLTLVVNDTPLVTPATVQSWQGFAITVRAPDQAAPDGTQLMFGSWLHGGKAEQVVVTPVGGGTYTATFTPARLLYLPQIGR